MSLQGNKSVGVGPSVRWTLHVAWSRTPRLQQKHKRRVNEMGVEERTYRQAYKGSKS